MRCLEYQDITAFSFGSCDIRHPEWTGDLRAAGAATLIVGEDVLLLHLATIDRLDALLAFKQIVIVDEVAYALAERYAEMRPFSDPWRLHRWIDQQARACRVRCPATWFGQKMTQVRDEAGDDEIELVIALDAMKKLVNREAFWRLAVIEHMARPESVASIRGPVILVVEDPRTAHHYDLIDPSRDDRCKTEHIDCYALLQVLGIKDDFIRPFVERVDDEECIG